MFYVFISIIIFIYIFDYIAYIYTIHTHYKIVPLNNNTLTPIQSEVRTSCAVEAVEFTPRNGDASFFDCHVIDEDDNSEVFDAVVFACAAPAMNRILHGTGKAGPGIFIRDNTNNGLNIGAQSNSFYNKAMGFFESFIFAKTLYTVDRDPTFEQGLVHSDAAAVFPPQFKDELLAHHCNYLEVDATNPENLENHFILSSWAPGPNQPEVKGQLPMLVSYNAPSKTEDVDVEWTVTSRDAHPCLTVWQMLASTFFWPFLQGNRNGQVYFCGSACTPGNGHDLSLLSGIVAAGQLGAPYPFPNSKYAKEDFERLTKMMVYGA